MLSDSARHQSLFGPRPGRTEETALFPELEPGAEIVLAMFENGGTTLRRAADPEIVSEVGPTTCELPAIVLAHLVTPHPRASRGVATLRVDRPWRVRRPPHFGFADGNVIGLTKDDQGEIRLTRKTWTTEAEASKRLRESGREWLLVRAGRAQLRPRLADADPFSTRVPLAGSLVGVYFSESTGVYVGDRDLFDQWILSFFPSQYTGVAVLERIEVVDSGAPLPDWKPPPREEDRQPFWVIGLTSGGSRLFRRFPTLDQARSHCRSHPGRWLIGEFTGFVSLR